MTRSVPLVLLILASAFLLTTCATRHPTMGPMTGPCSTAAFDPKAPIICIHDDDMSRITATPDEAKAYRGSVVHFWTASGNGTLAITSGTLPSDDIKCIPGTGHCFAKIRGDAPLKVRHKYFAIITREGRVGTSPDPTIIIDTN
jgi:hypothetical protein